MKSDNNNSNERIEVINVNIKRYKEKIFEINKKVFNSNSSSKNEILEAKN